jgi:hypothetical protein
MTSQDRIVVACFLILAHGNLPDRYSGEGPVRAAP